MTIATLDFERGFDLPPARLWHLLTDAGMREAWGAPTDDARLVMEETDLRQGGLERHRCGPADAPDFTVETRWYHLDPHTTACFTETVDVAGMRLFTSLVTYRLHARGTGTCLNIDIAISSFTGEDAEPDVRAGWTSALARLEKLAANAMVS